MTELAANNPWLLLILGVVVGMLLGGLLVTLLERKKSGGRSVEELQQELDDYKDEVGKHFATTSELFRDMTEKYRDVYNHLASGSQALCEDAMDHARLEFTQAKEVEGSDVAAEPTVADGQTEPSSVDPAKGPGDAASEPASPTSSDSAEQRDHPPLGV